MVGDDAKRRVENIHDVVIAMSKMSVSRLPFREAVAALKRGQALPVQSIKLRYVDKNASSGAR
jgi:hypothetical protein